MKKIVFFILLILAGLQVFAFAKVKIINRTAKLNISMPDAKTLTILPNEKLPEIPDEAIIEAVSNSATDIDSADILIKGQTIHLVQGEKIQIMTDGPYDGFNVLKGKLIVTTEDGMVRILSPIPGFKHVYKAPVIPDPGKIEMKIEEDEARPDISPIHA